MGPPRALVPLMPPLVNLSSLIDDARCYELVRQHRWPDGVRCPRRESAPVARDGRDDTQRHRQRYRCAGCGARFDGPDRDRFGRPPPAAAGLGAVPVADGPEPLERARLGAPPVAGETVGRMIDIGGARPLRFWWSGTPSSSLARGLLRTCEW